MPFYPGFDAAIYPGDDTMSWLRAHSTLTWCGYYLTPAPNLSPAADSWRGRRAALAASWGFAPVYVGQQIRHGAAAVSAILTFEQGCVDGLQAYSNARRDGFEAGSCLYLDWEDGGVLSENSGEYASGWAITVAARGYRPGIYCSHRLADSFAALLAQSAKLEGAMAPRFWCYAVSSTAEHPLATPLDALPALDPAGSGVDFASMWQREQNAWLLTPSGSPHPGQRLVIDLDTANLADPSAP